MDEILKELDMAFGFIESALISGSAVDNIAAAKVKLRGVYAELKKLSAEAKAKEAADG